MNVSPGTGGVASANASAIQGGGHGHIAATQLNRVVLV
jgi:hypothetical protein